MVPSFLSNQQSKIQTFSLTVMLDKEKAAHPLIEEAGTGEGFYLFVS